MLSWALFWVCWIRDISSSHKNAKLSQQSLNQEEQKTAIAHKCKLTTSLNSRCVCCVCSKLCSNYYYSTRAELATCTTVLYTRLLWIKQFKKRKMASPASSSIPPHSTTNVGPLNTSGTGGCAPLGAVPPGGAPGGNPMYMLQWHEHHASFFRSVIVLTYSDFITPFVP